MIRRPPRTPARAPSANPLQMGDLRITPPTDAHADDVDAHLRPITVLSGQPQTRQPPQSTHLVWRDGLLDAAEPVAGAGLHLDEHRNSQHIDGRDHVEFAVAATP